MQHIAEKVNETTRQNMAKVKVEGMACAHCEARVQKFLGEVPGITDVKADRTAKEAQFNIGDGCAVTDEAIMEAVRKAGFTPIEVHR